MGVCAPAVAQAQAPITVRFAVHDHFDRLVFLIPPDATFASKLDGSDLTIRFTAAGPVTGSVAPGHRMLGFEGRNGDVIIHLAPDTHPHVWQMDRRLVVDVDEGSSPDQEADPALIPAIHLHVLASRTLQPAPGEMPAAPTLAPLTPVQSDNLAPTDALGPAVPPPLPAAPAEAAAPVSGPIEVGSAVLAPSRAAVTVLPQEANSGGPAILIPFGADTGAAAFGRGGQGHVVFDSAHAADLGQLKDDPDFGTVTERVLPDGMDLRIPLAAGGKLLLARRPGGWSVTVVRDLSGQAAIAAHADHGILSLAAAAPGRTVVLDDEATGGKLLVGTQRVAGQNMPAPHRSAEFATLPTWQGVVVAPQSDRISLTPVGDGFRLAATSGPGLSLLWAEAAGRIMTRHFDFPDLPPPVLENRLSLDRRDAALTPRLARFPARLRVAQAMLADGLDVEARAVVHAATADDPAHAGDADAAGLFAIANWLVARAGGGYPRANAIDPAADPFSLGDSDEAQFWRALIKGADPDVAGPAATLAVTWPLLQQYPPGLRRRIAPAVAEIMDRGSQDKALAAFLAAFSDPSLDLVRADLLHRQGKTDDALAWLDAVAQRPNRLMQASAMREAVEMRLAAGKIDPATAEAALGRQIYAWRGGPSELALRLRVADLRARIGHWRQALALLRETDGIFPDSHPQLLAAQIKLIAALLHGDGAAKLSALDLVALAQEAAPLLSAADSDVTLAPVLVDKLLALDLPARAEPILQRLYDHAGAPAQKAELGVRLAGLLADRGDAKGALSVLDASDDSALQTPLVTQRGLLRARLLAASGRESDALGILSGVKGEAAIELQVKILEDRHEWAEGAKLLELLSASPSFAARPDQAQRDMILRLANDESEAGDMAALRRLRGAQGVHFASGPGAELFTVLTEEPIQAVDDLPRAGRELQAVRALPASLASH